MDLGQIPDLQDDLTGPGNGEEGEVPPQVSQVRPCSEEVVRQRQCRRRRGFLPDVGDAMVSSPYDLASARLDCADQQPQQRRLAGTVRANETDTIAGSDAKIGRL